MSFFSSLHKGMFRPTQAVPEPEPEPDSIVDEFTEKLVVYDNKTVYDMIARTVKFANSYIYNKKFDDSLDSLLKKNLDQANNILNPATSTSSQSLSSNSGGKRNKRRTKSKSKSKRTRKHIMIKI
jgi:hypothetical protein